MKALRRHFPQCPERNDRPARLPQGCTVYFNEAGHYQKQRPYEHSILEEKARAWDGRTDGDAMPVEVNC